MNKYATLVVTNGQSKLSDATGIVLHAHKNNTKADGLYILESPSYTSVEGNVRYLYHPIGYLSSEVLNCSLREIIKRYNTYVDHMSPGTIKVDYTIPKSMDATDADMVITKPEGAGNDIETLTAALLNAGVNIMTILNGFLYYARGAE